MSHFRTYASALLLTTALTPAAWADLTADQVWEQLQSQYTADSNAEMTFADPQRDGDTLVVSDIKVTSEMAMEQEIGAMKVSSSTSTDAQPGTMLFTEQGDGSVKITLDGTPVITIHRKSDTTFGEETTTEKTSFTLEVSHEGLETVASEAEDGAIKYDTRADKLTLEVTDAQGNEDVILGGFTGLNLNGVTGSQTIKTGDMIESSGDMMIRSLDYAMDVHSDISDKAMKFAGEIADISLTASATTPADYDSSKPEDIFTKGLDVDGTLTMGPSSMSTTISVDDNGTMQVESSSDKTSLEGRISKNGIAYNILSNAVAYNLVADSLPFPVKASANELGVKLAFPLAKSDKAEARLGLIFDGVELSDMIWGMADPQQILPRGPLTIRAGVSGALEVFKDVFNEDSMQSPTPPMQPLSAKIDELRIEGAGIKVGGAGAVDFDANDTTSYDGMRAPIGDVTVTAEGVNGLIDNLIKMGLIPEDQAMMPRMMLGMFAESTGDDAIQSHIEFKEGGHVFANGQQLR